MSYALAPYGAYGVIGTPTICRPGDRARSYPGHHDPGTTWRQCRPGRYGGRNYGIYRNPDSGLTHWCQQRCRKIRQKQLAAPVGYGSYGTGLEDWYYKVVPRDPQITVTNGEVCIDRTSEETMQMQRRLAYMAGGPLIILAGLQLKSNPLLGMVTTALGVACTMWHYTTHQLVEDAMAGAGPEEEEALSGYGRMHKRRMHKRRRRRRGRCYKWVKTPHGRRCAKWVKPAKPFLEDPVEGYGLWPTGPFADPVGSGPCPSAMAELVKLWVSDPRSAHRARARYAAHMRKAEHAVLKAKAAGDSALYEKAIRTHERATTAYNCVSGVLRDLAGG